ncbi:Hypothetical predicted protein [Cloeon dipterum]|uniref:Uncharacterized protein n=1 Tax=Cloeon dipterum TaxID=197152 RepID=A0A8S1DZ91_9INSE|nr:Hypothetical predicted protein [Cloeon dipterum]
MATNNDIRLKMTKSKMKIHRSTKLETIAAQSILRYLNSFLDPKYCDIRNAKHLPSALRNIVLQQWLMTQFADCELEDTEKWHLSQNECVKIFEKRMEVFNSLVSCHTLDVDFTPFIKDRYNYLARVHLLEYLKLIGTKATNLKVLIILETFHPNLWMLNRAFCNAIGKMRTLTSLNISNIQVNYTNLKAMCKNLKSLTHLSTLLFFNPSFDESNEREIEELQIFSNLTHFKKIGRYEEFTINCIQHLPKLQSIDNCTTSIIEELLDRCPNQKFALTRMRFTAPSNKEIHLNFPNVNDLKVRYRYSDVYVIPDSLPKFSKIENLILTNLPLVDTMIRFLDAYGHGLHSLRLSWCRGQFKLSSILDRCPKLQSVLLDSICILPECSRPDMHSFSTGLKELNWQPRFGDNTPLLLDILTVPTLESVTLSMRCQCFYLKDIEKLTAMIASRQILGNLKRLKIFVENIITNQDLLPLRPQFSLLLIYTTVAETWLLTSILFGMLRILIASFQNISGTVLKGRCQRTNACTLEWKMHYDEGANLDLTNAFPADPQAPEHLYFGRYIPIEGDIFYGQVYEDGTCRLKICDNILLTCPTFEILEYKQPLPQQLSQKSL